MAFIGGFLRRAQGEQSLLDSPARSVQAEPRHIPVAGH
ncbi:MAG: hypothetical protein ACI9HX_000022 [Pseudoalteromonas tetraodonis]|jgi:hypothetical protein